ncbi:hypothetical protein CI102_8305 [Trichoderma harzianum]|nr:hypothetical protein CI102_8305 [Trichoderma harzianum]
MGKQNTEQRVKLTSVAKSEKKRRNGEPNCLDNELARVGKSKRWFFSKRLHACRVDATRRRGNDAVSEPSDTTPRRPTFAETDGYSTCNLQFSSLNGSFDEILLFKLGDSYTQSHEKNSIRHLCSLGVYIFLKRYSHQDCRIPKSHQFRYIHVKTIEAE